MRGAANHAALRQPSAVKLEGRAVHIVTASDENYVVGVMVLIASVARHNPQARFTVLTTEWSPASHAKLQQLRQRLGLQIECIEISAQSLRGLPISRPHLTRTTYARLFIPAMLPAAERVIYMDCDMLVTGALDQAWNCDLTGKVLAAVRCPTPTRSFAAAIDLSVEHYFNAGFLVLNLDLWRSEHLAEQCITALSATDCRYLSQDESALNHIARGRVQYLDAGFNLYALDRIWQSPLSDPQAIRVIHYITRPKPWNGNCPFGNLWLQEVARLPEMHGFRPEPQSLRARLTRLNRIRKAYMGQWVGKVQYARQIEAHQLVHQVLAPRYVTTGHF